MSVFWRLVWVDFESEWQRRWALASDDSLSLVQVSLGDYAARLAGDWRWHPTQELRELDATRTKVKVCIEVGPLGAVVRWVPSFGSKAPTIGPPELKRMVHAGILLMGG